MEPTPAQQTVFVNASVSPWRDAVGADLVVQLVLDGQNGVCGQAQLPTNISILGSRSWLYQYGYSVNAYRISGGVCPSTTVGHEMGHNLTLWHDRTTLGQNSPPPYPAIFDYGFGHRIDACYGP